MPEYNFKIQNKKTDLIGYSMSFQYSHMYGNCGFDVIHSMVFYRNGADDLKLRKEARQLASDYLYFSLIGKDAPIESENYRVVIQRLNAAQTAHEIIPAKTLRIPDRTHSDKAIIMTDVIENIKETRSNHSRILGFYLDTKKYDCWTVMDTWVHKNNYESGRGIGVLMFNPTENKQYKVDIDKLSIFQYEDIDDEEAA